MFYSMSQSQLNEHFGLFLDEAGLILGMAEIVGSALIATIASCNIQLKPHYPQLASLFAPLFQWFKLVISLE
jgi:hypothetical protein